MHTKSLDAGTQGKAPNHTTREKPFHSPGYHDDAAETSSVQGPLRKSLVGGLASYAASHRGDKRATWRDEKLMQQRWICLQDTVS